MISNENVHIFHFLKICFKMFPNTNNLKHDFYPTILNISFFSSSQMMVRIGWAATNATWTWLSIAQRSSFRDSVSQVNLNRLDMLMKTLTDMSPSILISELTPLHLVTLISIALSFLMLWTHQVRRMGFQVRYCFLHLLLRLNLLRNMKHCFRTGCLSHRFFLFFFTVVYIVFFSSFYIHMLSALIFLLKFSCVKSYLIISICYDVEWHFHDDLFKIHAY